MESQAQRTERIRAMQRRIQKSYPAAYRAGCDDGFWGPRSIKACQLHLRGFMPEKSPWPNSDKASLLKFYGTPGDEGALVNITFPYPIYYGGTRVLRSRCHEKVAEPLLRVLKSIKDLYGQERGIMEEAEDYGGIYNYRLKRGGTSWSLHAWGAAIDLDADDNTFRDSWPLQADMPLEICEEFAKEGFVSAGPFWGYDAMHHQGTKV
jgi:hypothetical protein